MAGRLSGDLVCMRCGYDLSGLSITGQCPECALPIKATLLAVVDPRAEVLAPLLRPALTAWSFVLWAAGAVLLAAAGWMTRTADVVQMGTSAGPVRDLADLGMIAGAGGLVLGATGLFRPIAHIGLREALRDAVGLGLIAFSACAAAYLHLRLDPFLVPYLEPVPELRTLIHASAALAGAVGLLALRPTLRRLAERSWVMRQGQVQRQPVRALAGALAVVALGDGLAIAAGQSSGPVAGWLSVGHVVVVALGSVLFTVGVVNMFRDALRLRPVLVSRTVGLSHVMDDREDRRE